ncbi:MAG: alpha/beta fold hydrolase [Burkholderiales bacterium]
MPDGAAESATLPFRGPRWLPGGHAQTIYPYFLARPRIEYRRERITTRDGDFWDFDWLVDAPGVAPDAPLVALFHGLEGGAQSHYALLLMERLAARGWRGVVPHFRGCGGTPNVRPRAYHSGDYEEVEAMLAELRARVDPRTPMYAVGVSLGGSALLNWIGRAGTSASRTLVAAAAVSVPLDLMAAGIAIGQGLNRIYTWYFLRTLKPKALAMAERFPGLLDTARVARTRTMWEFDDSVTAPLHGFAGTHDYWTRASSIGWLRDVRLPTLVLNARNDPFVPGASLPSAQEVAKEVTLEQPAGGGHVGFMTGPAPGRLDWMPRRVLAYFDRGA